MRSYLAAEARAELARRLFGLPLGLAGGDLAVAGRQATCVELDALWAACRAAAPRPTELGAFKVRRVLFRGLPAVSWDKLAFEAPEIDAYELDGGAVAWCPHCRFWHLHGVPASGSRGPHCYVSPHPFPFGYRLRDNGAATAAVRRDVRRRKQMWVP